MIQNYFVITSAQRTALMAFNNDDVAIDPRAIDNDSPGTGINLSDRVSGTEPAAVVTLTGRYIAPKRIVDDPEYVKFAPDMIAYLLENCPFCTLEDETILAPVRGPTI